MRSVINWKIFFILLSISLMSVMGVFPYVLTLQGEVLNQLGISVGFLILAQFIQSIFLFSFTIFFGLLLSKRVGFRLPLIDTILEKENYKKILSGILGKSLIIGAVTAVIIYFVDALFTASGAGITTHQSYAPIWQKLLASFYGGIVEEVLMRLFLMTLLVWIGMKLGRRNRPTIPGITISIILAAIIFGLGHLPITSSITVLTPLVVGRAIVLNGIGGVVFGWLFWKKGLESAMIAHFTADIFLLTLLPLVLK